MPTAPSLTLPGNAPGRASRIPFPATTVGVEHECKWALEQADGDTAAGVSARSASTGPHAFFDSGPLSLLTPVRRPLVFVQSSLYVDDQRHRLIRAGHSLSVVVNTGAASSVCWLTLKQAVHWRGWRDGLEVSQRLTPAEVPGALNDPSLLPVAHLRGSRLAEGPLRAVGTATQRRHKHLGRTADGVEVAYSLDLVTFRAPEPGVAPVRGGVFVEIEVNSSAPAALRALDRLAHEVDAWLGRPRDRTTKAQRALAALGTPHQEGTAI
ncbi:MULTISPECIES: hypothetical protein [unclassified Streptomyces]|uniref:hypothetical protein n=1 Tax=unclassified Streptomyces TaxID=2593676 RepID=UPI0038233497